MHACVPGCITSRLTMFDNAAHALLLPLLTHSHGTAVTAGVIPIAMTSRFVFLDQALTAVASLCCDPSLFPCTSFPPL